eukprot:COSAG06_NODE_24192_length_670_cov_0.784588_1_plen_49_part_01
MSLKLWAGERDLALPLAVYGILSFLSTGGLEILKLHLNFSDLGHHPPIN